MKEEYYSRIIKKMSYGYENILFDHIDQIPDIPDKEDLEFLVYMALKRDLLPLEQGMCVSELDFSQMMIERWNLGLHYRGIDWEVKPCSIQP